MSETTKIDLKKEYKTLYQPSKKQVEQVDVPAFNYLMIDGAGDLNTSQIYQEAIAQVQQKKGLPALAQLRFESFHEGRCAQIMHVGPFSEEGPTVQRVHEFIEARATLSGKHHEIYLSDIRRADPSKWKTIIRQPMQ